MHIAVSWDISASGDRWNDINNELKAVIAAYSWVKPLNTFYIIKIDAEPSRRSIKDQLIAVARKTTETVHFVVTPVMSGGRYDGFLPKDTWELINQRTDQ